jgi:hypothetical protein
MAAEWPSRPAFGLNFDMALRPALLPASRAVGTAAEVVAAARGETYPH